VDPGDLAANLNQHNEDKHPFQLRLWTASSIIHASYYISPEGDMPSDSEYCSMYDYAEQTGFVPSELTNGEPRQPGGYGGCPLPEYTKPYVNKELWGDAKHAPVITSEDLALLAINKIKW